MSILTATNINKSFNGAIALKDASVRCEKGRIIGLLGANGSGKSTISKIICGVYKKDSGTIIYKGEEINYKDPSEGRAHGVSMIFQNLSLLNDMTIWQNIVLGIEDKKRLFLDNKKSIEIAEGIMKNLMPDLDVNRKVQELNPGQKQITEIAKGLSCNPEVLFLDEPTAALSQREVAQLFKYMRQMKEEGVAQIFTSHRTHEVIEICDEIIVFRNGENVGEINFDNEPKDEKKILELIMGQKIEGSRHKEYTELSDEVVFSAKNIGYGQFVKNLSFDLHKGEVLGIGGLSGQGQTELMLALAGNYPETTGELTINGKKISTKKPKEGIREGVLLVPGDRLKEGLFADKSIRFNIYYSRMGLKKQPLFVPKKQLGKDADYVCKELSVRMRDINSTIDSLSGGNQQKVVVGKWLTHDMKVILLADPAKGVDIGAKNDLYAYIMNLVKTKNVSVILYASDNEELVEYCDRVLVMYEGGVVSELRGDEITDDEITKRSMFVE